MKQIDKYWKIVKKKSPKILAILGSIGTGVTAYLAAKNEAEYQRKRFDYYLENGMFPEELSYDKLTKDEIREKGYKILGDHLKQHTTTFISGGLTVASIYMSNYAWEKRTAMFAAMNLGIGNMIAKRKGAEDEMLEKRPNESKGRISREEIQDYLIQEAYNNDLVYYTTIESRKDDEEFIWLDIFPSNKIFIVKRNDVNSLPWFINVSLKEQNYVSYGEIFDFLNIYANTPKDFVDDDINEWIYMYGFSKDPEELLNIEVYAREVTVDDGITVTALSFSLLGNAIDMM